MKNLLVLALLLAATSEAQQQTTEIDVTGTGITAPCSLVPSAPNLAFGETKVGEMGAKTFYFHNEGGLNCLIDSVEIEGDPSFRVELPNLPRPFLVLPDARFAIHVHFHPESTGNKSATISVVWRPE